jgi:PmbA protein
MSVEVERLLEIGDRVVAMAGDDEQVEAVVVHDRETEIRVYETDIESFSSAESAGVGIRVIRDHRQGFAYAGSLDDDVLAETLAEARDNAEFGTPDEDLGLAEPDGVAEAELDLWSEELLDFPTDRKIELAIELERRTLAADRRMSGLESAEYVDAMSAVAVVSTTGVRSAGRESGCYLMVYALASEAGETQTGFGWSIGRDPSSLDPGHAAGDAALRATRLLGGAKPSSERVTVVLDPFVTAQLLAIIGRTLSGEAVLKGRSLFADRVGEAVGAAGLTLVDDPTNASAYTATTQDGEGLATRRNALIERGVLQGFVHNAYTARRLGTHSTGSAVRGFKTTPGVGCLALALEPGSRPRADLIAEVDDGILVQGVAGLHSGVNPVSGDFSTGAEGLRIRHGEVAEPLREFTIASTLQRLLLGVREVGGDLEWLPMSAAGLSLVIDEVTMSGS